MYSTNPWLKRAAFAAVICVCLTSVVSADTFGTGPNQFDIDFIRIAGDNGNLGSWDTGTNFKFTGVNRDDYRIGQYEITYMQWKKFKNSLGTAVTGSPAKAYDLSPSFYGFNRPVNCVSWYEAAQFVNWLNTSKGYHAAYKFTGTQGTSDYKGEAWSSSEAYGNNTWRHKDAMYYLPNEDEWLKAAYWNGVALQRHATKPGETLHQGTGDNGTGWNYFHGIKGGYATDDQNTWDVGSGSEELNGTFDMMGNVEEWIESSSWSSYDYDAMLRMTRGGAYWENTHYYTNTESDDMAYAETSAEYYTIGFRVAANVPEPMTMGILVLGGLGLLRRKRK